MRLRRHAHATMGRNPGFGVRAAFCALALVTSSAAFAQTLGGFDLVRGSGGSFADSPWTAPLRSSLSSNLGPLAYSSTTTLSSAYLSSVDVVFIAVTYDAYTPIAPLSAGEQQALLDFVRAGGSAFLFADNDFQFQDSSNSFLAPFGAHVTGHIAQSPSPVTVVDFSNPITNGVFGTVAAYDTIFPGYFDAFGTAAVVLGLSSAGSVALTYIPKGALSPRSGVVLLFSDAAPILGNDARSNALIENGLAYALAAPVPEPGTGMLCFAGVLLGVLGGWWRAVASPAAPVSPRLRHPVVRVDAGGGPGRGSLPVP